MLARALLVVLPFACGCGPDVESTSETLSDSQSGSADGSDDDSNSGGGSGGDADSADGSDDGGNSGGDPCNGETPPGILAFVDAIDRLEAAEALMDADIDAVRQQLALHFGLPATAGADEIAAAIDTAYAASTVSMPALIIDQMRCTGSLAAARENLGICLPDLDVAAVTFECDGECTVAAPTECAGAATCRGVAASCTGLCTGSCDLEAGGSCEGVCTGECDGECNCVDSEGVCMGLCTGLCMGTCDVAEASCAGECLGTCSSADAQECDGAWVCPTVGLPCSVDCASSATPLDVGYGCDLNGRLAGAASMNCDPPFVSLVYASTSCSDFAATATVLEEAAARLQRDADHLTLFGNAAGAIIDYLVMLEPPVDELPPCVNALVVDYAQRLAHHADVAAEATNTILPLLQAIMPP